MSHGRRGTASPSVRLLVRDVHMLETKSHRLLNEAVGDDGAPAAAAAARFLSDERQNINASRALSTSSSLLRPRRRRRRRLEVRLDRRLEVVAVALQDRHAHRLVGVGDTPHLDHHGPLQLVLRLRRSQPVQKLPAAVFGVGQNLLLCLVRGIHEEEETSCERIRYRTTGSKRTVGIPRRTAQGHGPVHHATEAAGGHDVYRSGRPRVPRRPQNARAQRSRTVSKPADICFASSPPTQSTRARTERKVVRRVLQRVLRQVVLAVVRHLDGELDGRPAVAVVVAARSSSLLCASSSSSQGGIVHDDPAPRGQVRVLARRRRLQLLLCRRVMVLGWRVGAAGSSATTVLGAAVHPHCA
jgi:hypothetical protein